MRGRSYEAPLLSYKSIHEANHPWKTDNIWETIPWKKICHHQQLKKEIYSQGTSNGNLFSSQKKGMRLLFLFPIWTLTHCWHSWKDWMQFVFFLAVWTLAHCWHSFKTHRSMCMMNSCVDTTTVSTCLSEEYYHIWNRLVEAYVRHDFKVLNFKWLWRDFNAKATIAFSFLWRQSKSAYPLVVR